MRKRISMVLAGVALAALASSWFSVSVFAHCDSMDGPVIQDAKRAIAQKDVTPVLKWVRAEDADEIRHVFRMAMAIRGESSEAREVADRYFFETLVRVHRASEGEPFTGLKPAGSAGPAITAADAALAEGRIDHLADKIADAVHDSIVERFNAAYEAKQRAGDSVKDGREYARAYVQFVHFVEAVHGLAAHGAGHGHASASDR
jgi:hypothetical protein